jgi:hypothetical protein
VVLSSHHSSNAQHTASVFYRCRRACAICMHVYPYRQRVAARPFAGVLCSGQQLIPCTQAQETASVPCTTLLSLRVYPIAHGSGGDTGEVAHRRWPQVLQV